jgi:uncharacterized membrane protein YfcA
MGGGEFVLAGAFTGFWIGLTGVGGGALMAPILLLIFGIEPATAVATDLWFAVFTKVAGSWVHRGAGQVDWQVARRLWAGSLPVAILVAIGVSLGIHPGRQQGLSQAIGVVVLITAAGLLASPRLFQIARHRRLDAPEHFKALQPALTVMAGAALGFCVALTSVGAGALGSVLLTYLYPLRMKPHRLVATDLVHAVPLAMVAGLGYLLAGLVNWPMLAELLIGSLPAVLLGSTLASRVPGRALQIALALTLVLAGAKLIGF